MNMSVDPEYGPFSGTLSVESSFDLGNDDSTSEMTIRGTRGHSRDPCLQVIRSQTGRTAATTVQEMVGVFRGLVVMPT